MSLLRWGALAACARFGVVARSIGSGGCGIVLPEGICGMAVYVMYYSGCGCYDKA